MTTVTHWLCQGPALIIFIVLKFAYSEEYVGDFCTLQRTNATGQCKFLPECPMAVEDLRCRGIPPQTCGFEKAQPIVCCVENTSHTETPVESKSKQKCKEYAKRAAEVPGLEGVQKECDFYVMLLTVRGNKANPKEFPHMAAIGFEDKDNKKSWLCSGALISDQFVLTAAHCLHDREYGEPKYVRVGDLDLDSNDDDSAAQEFRIAEQFLHPDYKPPSVYNDIALLKLDKTAVLGPYVTPACLKANATGTAKNPTATGWDNEIFKGDASLHLLRKSMHYFGHAECDHLYRNASPTRRLKNGILEETQVCAGPPDQIDTCVMATGGVLQEYNEEVFCTYRVVGITSFGGDCGTVNVPTVFTRVSPYVGWIEGIVWPS